MNYLSPYDPPEKEPGLLPAIRRTGQQAISHVPGARWVFKIVDHLLRQMSCAIAAYKYRREIRKNFQELMRGWGASDARTQAAYRFCMRAHNMMSDGERQEQFMMAVVAFAQWNTQQAIDFFAEREREYIEAYFNGFSISFA